jgi:hypothetical protein
MLPLEVELIIYKYLHELYTTELKKELIKNIKTSVIYKLKWKGNIDYDDEYDRVILDKNISSLFFKNKLHKQLDLSYYYSYE